MTPTCRRSRCLCSVALDAQNEGGEETRLFAKKGNSFQERKASQVGLRSSSLLLLCESLRRVAGAFLSGLSVQTARPSSRTQRLSAKRFIGGRRRSSGVASSRSEKNAKPRPPLATQRAAGGGETRTDDRRISEGDEESLLVPDREQCACSQTAEGRPTPAQSAGNRKAFQETREQKLKKPLFHHLQ